MAKTNGQDKNAKVQRKTNVSINLDTTPILYTDNIFLSINDNGVVLDIAQRVGPSNQLRIVSRIGMSREHAKKFVEKLGSLVALKEAKSQTGKVVN